MTTHRKILVCLQLAVLMLLMGGLASACAGGPMPENKAPGCP